MADNTEEDTPTLDSPIEGETDQDMSSSTAADTNTGTEEGNTNTATEEGDTNTATEEGDTNTATEEGDTNTATEEGETNTATEEGDTNTATEEGETVECGSDETSSPPAANNENNQEDNNASNDDDIVTGVRTSVFEGHRLEAYIWEPEDETPKALLCLCHGVHEHLGRYEKLIDHLKKEGILVFGIDLVGHGNSEGVRGHIDEIQSYVTDVMRYAEDVKGKYPDMPMFLMGHSMGGLIASMCTIQRDTPLFTGLLLSSPGLLLGPDVGVIKRTLTKVLASVAPLVGVLSVDPAVISSIPEEVEAYQNDPLNIHSPLKAGWAAAMMRAIRDYVTRYGELTLPLYVMHGTGDQLVPITASELVYNSASSSDKVYEVFVDSFHEILHDIEQERARELISTWIKARLSGPVQDQ